MKIKCNIITAPIRDLAKELQVSAEDACNLVSVWQSEKKTTAMPTSTDIKPYLYKRKEISLEVPIYIQKSYEQEKKLGGTERATGTIYLTDWYKNSKGLELFFDYIRGGEGSESSEQKKIVFDRLAKEGYTEDRLRSLISSAKLANMFILYHEMSHVQNNDMSTYNTKELLKEPQISMEYRATLDALKKIEKWKKTARFSTSKNSDYPSRTQENIDNSDITVAFAVNFRTPGEIGTEKKAKGKYVAVQLTENNGELSFDNNSLDTVVSMASIIGRPIKMNIAGNSIPTFTVGQDKVNDAIEKALKYLQDKGVQIEEIRSGGQTGADEAGIIAAQRLGIPSIVHGTSDWKFRPSTGKDVMNEEQFRARFDIEEDAVVDSPYPTIGKEVLSINRDNPVAKLSREMNPIERQDRVVMIAKQFSNIVDNLVETTIEELNDAIAESSSVEERTRLLQRLEVMNDSVKGRRAVIEQTTVEAIFNQLKDTFESYTEMTAEELDEDYGEGQGAHILDAYTKVLDNFDALIEEACTIIEGSENMRIVIEKNTKHNGKTSEEVVGGSTMDTAQTDEAKEEQFGDDESGNRVDGNGGWSFKVRFVDPYTSLSKGVKKVLSNIKREGIDGYPEVDDLGYIRYVNEEYAHAVLINELSWMIDSDDFCYRNEDGTYELPALEKVAKKYPWVNQVISALQTDPKLVSAFYADFRKDFIPYTMYKFDEELDQYIFFHMNRPTALDSTRARVLSNYEQGTALDMDAVYALGGNINKDNANKGVELSDSVLNLLREVDEDDYDEIVNTASKGLKMLGIPVNPHIISSLLETDEGIVNLEQAMNAMKDIFVGIEKMPEGAHLVNTFNQEYNTIASIIGEVSELDNVQSFRQGDKSYYSYSAPNYLDTMFKSFKSDERREAYLKEQFSKYSWFYKNGKWRNEWLRQIAEDEDVRDLMQLDELNNIDGVEYSNWGPLDIKRTFIAKYFDAGYNEGSKKQFAWYNFPIFSDSPVVKFIKFTRYTGDFKEQLKPLFNQLVHQELGRIKLVEDRKKAGVNSIANFDKNGNKFHFIPELNSYQVGEVLFIDAIMEAAKKEDSTKVDAIIDEAVSTIMEANFQQFKEDNFNEVSIGILGKSLVDIGAIASEESVDSALEEYFWNSAYATSQIIQLTTTDLAYYKNGVDFQKRYKEVYAAGTKLNTNSPYGRKTEKTIYLSDQIITSSSYNAVKVSLKDAVKAGHITKTDMDTILDKFKDINVADAQAYRSLSSMRAVLDMMGAWTPEMQDSMDRFTRGEWDMADFNTVWQTIKPFVFTQIEKPDGLGGVIKVPHQNKNSEFLLLAMHSMVASSTGQSPKMRAINRFMEDNSIDVAQFESAVKAGKQGCIDISYSASRLEDWKEANPKEWEAVSKSAEKSMGNKFGKASDFDKFKAGNDYLLDHSNLSQEEYNNRFEYIEPTEEEVYNILTESTKKDGGFNEEVVHEIPYSDYVIQQPTPEHLFDVTDAVFGSQFRNLIISDMPNDPDFRVTVNGKKYTKQEVLDMYQSIIVENLLDDFARVKGRFESIESLQSAMLQQVKGNPKYGRDMVNALELIEIVNPITGEQEKTFNIPLNNPSTTKKIQELVTSMFKNAVTKQTIRGGACILVSNFGLTDKLHILHNEDGSIKGAECYLPAYSKQFYTPFMVTKTDSMGNEYQELDIEKMPEELRKLVGYRIPTEDKYSMIPLIVKGFLPQQNGSSIMVPADITQIAGSDFDVDKMFLMIPEFRVSDEMDWKQFISLVMKNEGFKKWGIDNVKMTIDMIKNGNISFSEGSPEMALYDYYDKVKDQLTETKIRKVKYDVSKAPQDQSRAARNNMLIDIAYGVLTNKDTAEKIHNPGNFDRAKTGARVANIVGNKSMFSQFMKEHNFSSMEAAAEYLLSADLSSLDKFVDEYRVERNPLSLDTFIYNHRQNMTGSALIGMYANNTTMQAKFQVTNIGIKNDHVFMINGRKVQSLSNITSDTGERISKNCANFSAASVDNVKDPVLADLMQNTQTANIAGFMLRAGMSIQEISLLFTQPIVKDCITKEGNIENLPKYINSALKRLRDLGGNVDLKKAIVHDFTSKELIMNIIGDLNSESLSKEQKAEHLGNGIRASLLVMKIGEMAQELSELTKISRADSPNGAISTSIAGAKIQTQKVNVYERKSKSSSFHLTGMQDIMRNNFVTLDMSKDTMRAKFLSSKMPMLQAFYSLGIELGTKAIAPHFVQSTPYVDNLVNEVFKNSSKGVINEEILDIFYDDLVTFGLTKTRLFGNDGTSTFDEKRDYYLYSYPEQFIKVLADNPDIANLNIMRKIQVQYGEIRLNKSGRLTPLMRESLMRDLDTLLYMDNPNAQKLAIDLFMYSFYKDGFKFGPNSYGNFFSTHFLNSFPEFISTLREMKFNLSEGTYFDNFLPQFYGNHYNRKGVVPSISEPLLTPLKDGSVLVKRSAAQNKNVRGTAVWDFITFQGELYSVDRSRINKDFVVYTKAPVIVDPQRSKYNAAMTVEEMADIKVDSAKVKNAKKIQSRQQPVSEKSLDTPHDDSYWQSLDNAISSMESYSVEEGQAELLDPLC